VERANAGGLKHPGTSGWRAKNQMAVRVRETKRDERHGPRVYGTSAARWQNGQIGGKKRDGKGFPTR